MRKFFIFFVVGLFLISFAFAADKIDGKIYDNTGLIGNDEAVQSYINKISEEIGAVVIIMLENELIGDYDTWAKDTATKMRLRDIGEPKKNVLIGYFKKENLVYVTSKNDGKVKTSLKDEIVSLLKVAIDEKSDEKFLAALKVLGEGLGVKEEKKKVLTMEECKETLDGRKRYLEIPEKFCYWEAMTELYDEKCENLDREQISEIFEKKAVYRKLNNSDWPSLNTDGDFCVSVVYDCDGWFNTFGTISENTYARVIKTDPLRKIRINPFLDFSKSKMQNLLIHKALHSVQEINGYNVFGSVGMFNAYEELTELDSSFKEMDERREVLTDSVTQIITSKINEDIDKCDEAEDYMKCIEDIDKNSLPIFKYQTDLSVSVAPIELLNYVSEDHHYYEYLKSNKKYNEIILELNNFLIEDYVKIRDLVKARGCTADTLELDPRLSEVNRWWLDQTSPDCKIIYTSEEASKVLTLFLIEENLPIEYRTTQKELKDFMIMAGIQDIEGEIHNKLINRLPGLVYDDSLDDSTSDYA